MRDRETNAQESQGERRPAIIETQHGRHGGSEESEGAPQDQPRTGEPERREAEPSRSAEPSRRRTED